MHRAPPCLAPMLGTHAPARLPQLLVDFTQAQASSLLDSLTAQAASKLGLPGVPADATLLAMIKQADARYILYGPSTQAAAATAGVMPGAELTAHDTLSWPFP